MLLLLLIYCPRMAGIIIIIVIIIDSPRMAGIIIIIVIIIDAPRMAGIPEDDEMLPSCVEDVRASIDLDGDGDITKEEFVRNALKNDFISKLLKYDYENDLPWKNQKKLYNWILKKHCIYWYKIKRKGAAKIVESENIWIDIGKNAGVWPLIQS